MFKMTNADKRAGANIHAMQPDDFDIKEAISNAMQPEREATRRLVEALEFIANQNDLDGNWAVEKARATLKAYREQPC